MAVCLTILEPDQPERSLTYNAQTDVIIGRASRCDIRIEFDPLVSRLHASIHMEPQLALIRDLGSRNGLVINGMRFDGVVNQRIIKPRTLRDGDTVVMGRTSVRINIVEDGDNDSVPPRPMLREAPSPAQPPEATWIGGPTAEDNTDTAAFSPALSG